MAAHGRSAACQCRDLLGPALLAPADPVAIATLFLDRDNLDTSLAPCCKSLPHLGEKHMGGGVGLSVMGTVFANRR